MVTAAIEMRCPVDSQRMFGKFMLEQPPTIVEGNLIEFSCDKCRRKQGGRRVFHYFNLLGECVETSVE